MARYHTQSFVDADGKMGQRNVQFTAEEETARDAEEAQATKDADDYAKVKYKDDRKKAYGDIGDQLDMRYKDLLNGTTTWKDHVAKVKSDHPKPE